MPIGEFPPYGMKFNEYGHLVKESPPLIDVGELAKVRNGDIQQLSIRKVNPMAATDQPERYSITVDVSVAGSTKYDGVYRRNVATLTFIGTKLDAVKADVKSALDLVSDK